VPSRRTRALGGLVALLVLGVGCHRAPEPAPPPPAVERELRPLAEGWRFHEGGTLPGAEVPTPEDAGWSDIAMPHTWGRKHLRSAWYQTRFRLGPGDLRGRLYLRFEGVAAVAEVFVNGVRLGDHRGAYTAFVFDATPHVKPGENELALRVSNHPEDTADCLPSGLGGQDYWVYGGIYRKAWLLRTPDVHVDPTDHAASGVFVTPLEVTQKRATLEVRTRLRNAGPQRRQVEVRHRLVDGEGIERAVLRVPSVLDPGASAETLVRERIAEPRLWSPADPYLYTLRTEIESEGRVIDLVTERTGFRDFRLEGEAFRLNGSEILLRGVGKHQESERNLTAMSDAELREDFANLRELGVNFVRLAHYPHASLAYDLADEQGLLVWAENGHSNDVDSVPGETGERITREMIRQHYNHPSIAMWSVGNETSYIRVRWYSAVAQEEDATRLVTYASNIGKRNKKKFPDLDFIGENTYRGWYRGGAWELEERFLRMRYLAENGAGAVVSHHTDYQDAHHVVDVFEPEEYRQRLAEVQYQLVFRDHPRQIPLYSVWILRDFATDKFKERNTKGLLTYSNLRKDAYYLYRSFLRPEEPLIHITSPTFFLRNGRPTNGVKVYSNRPALALIVNGARLETRRNGEFRHDNGRRIDNVFYWPARLQPGRNEIIASDDSGHQDGAVVYYQGDGHTAPQPEDGAVVSELRSSNPGTPAYFINQPVRAQWPFYSEFDGSADNTFDAIPRLAEGAGWITTGRLSKPGRATELSFTVRSDAAVLVMVSADSRHVAALERAGFSDTGWHGEWRDNDLRLVPARLLSRDAAAGARIVVPAGQADYVVMLKAR
jgi:beta-galactosidase